MKKFLMIKWCIVLCVMLSAIGCSEPVEGKRTYKYTWNYTTTQEKILYSEVEQWWGEEHLAYVREALRKRESKPDEAAFPFKDIAAIIIMNNDVTLKGEKINHDHNNGTEDGKREHRIVHLAHKWDSVDPGWYAKLLATYNYESGNSIALPVPSRTVIPRTVSEAVNVNAQETSKLLDYNEYDRLTNDVASCKPAKDLLSQIFQAKRFLTVDDREQIMQKVLYCKSLELESAVNN